MKKLLPVLLLLLVMLPAWAQLKSETFIARFGNLDNVWYRISARKKAAVAFLGGSITNMEGWRGMVGDYLVRTYPATAFTLLNAGIPSLGSLPHAFRLQQDVLDKGPVYFNTIRQLLDSAFRKTAPRKAVAAVLPPASDPFSYDAGHYVDVHTARRLRDFTVDESWKPSDKVRTRPGFVDVPMLVSGTTEATMELSFTGRTVGVALLSGPDAGVLRYSIDGKAVQQIDTRTQWSSSLYLPWYLVLGDKLATGTHTLKITTAPGSICRIVHFLVNP